MEWPTDEPNRNANRTITWLAVLVALAVAVFFPAGYFYTAYSYETEHLRRDSHLAAGNVSRFIYVLPRLWRFQNLRLDEVLSHSTADASIQFMRVVDADGNTVSKFGSDLPPPVITRVAPLRVGNRTVGRLEASVSLRPVITKTAVTALLAILLGLMSFLVLRVLPLRALARATDHLEAALAKLRRSETQLRTLTDSLPAGIIYLDTQHRFLFANKQFLTWWTQNHAAVLGMTMESVTGPEIYGDFLPHLEQALNGEPADFEISIPASAMDDRKISVTCVPHIEENLEVCGVFGLLEDITERREMESRFRHAQKMEAVGQLTGGVAHDFNNLLTVILGNLEMLERRVKDDPTSRKMAAAAADAARRGADLTARLLTYSRKQFLVPQTLDINVLVLEIDALLRQTLGETILVETMLAGDVWPVRLDRSQLENALVNLAVNARDAMPEGGKLTLETRNVHLDEDYAAQNVDVISGRYVALFVSDTGAGIAPEVMDRIFEPFYTTKPVGAGTGLGLSMVYGFVKQSGGHIKIYSEVGHGTIIKLYFPRAEAACSEVTVKPANDGRPPRGKETILVVDDNPDVRATTVTLLESMGYTTREAQDGPSALAMLEQEHDIALLFTDMLMPGGMNGAELAGKALDIAPDVKVLYTSGFTESAFACDSDPLTDVELVSKPYRSDELARKIRGALDG